MRINQVSLNSYTFQHRAQTKKPAVTSVPNYSCNSLLPLYQIPFLGQNHQGRSVDVIDYFKFKKMRPSTKEFYRKKCADFQNMVNVQELRNQDKKYLPLLDDKVMEQFIDVCNIYKNMKDNPIICLGRSPKWFLNGALWLKDSIDDYKFAAFSGYWYLIDKYGDLYKSDKLAPTEEEKKSYKRYLNSIRVTPKHIVDVCEKTGKKVIITDYIGFGKGMCSFLDLMSEYAQEQGCLEEFADSIKIVTIGSQEYKSRFYFDDEDIPAPRVQFPESLWEYQNKIEQEYYDIPIEVFEQMLINENTNECRSSYYPHEAWTAYKPDKVKTGMIGEKKIQEIRAKNKRYLHNFAPTMCDYRNLLNFRILDYMDQKGILRESLNSKQWD